MMRTAVFSLLCLTSLLAVAEKQPFDRYQSIVDRQMFGQPPRGFDPTKMPSEVSKAATKEQEAEQEKLQSAVIFSAINVLPSGEAKVAFTDNHDPKQPRYYYMKVGETNDGWTVTSIDPKAAEMVAEKNGIEVSLKLGGDSSKNPEATSRAGGGASRPGARPSGGLLGSNSLRGRRQLREQLAADEAAKAAKAQAERDAREAEEKAQRDEERQQQRDQLLAIQEELKKAREAQEKAAAEKRARGEEDNPE